MILVIKSHYCLKIHACNNYHLILDVFYEFLKIQTYLSTEYKCGDKIIIRVFDTTNCESIDRIFGKIKACMTLRFMRIHL